MPKIQLRESISKETSIGAYLLKNVTSEEEIYTSQEYQQTRMG